MQTQEQAAYLTVEEAAVRARVSSPTIRRALKSGALTYRATRGKTKLLRAGDVDAWAQDRIELRQIENIENEVDDGE